MADTQSYKLRFTWYDIDGETKTMTLAHPNPDVTAEQVQTVLDTAVAVQPFQNVTLESGIGAELVENVSELIEYTLSE